MINEISQNCTAARRRMRCAGDRGREKLIDRSTDLSAGQQNKMHVSKKTTQNEMNESKISSVRKNLISSVRLCLMSKRTAYTIISFNWITFWACDFRPSIRRETCAAYPTTTSMCLNAYGSELKKDKDAPGRPYARVLSSYCSHYDRRGQGIH